MLREAEAFADRPVTADINMDVYDKVGTEQKEKEAEKQKQKLDQEDKAFLELFDRANKGRNRKPVSFKQEFEQMQQQFDVGKTEENVEMKEEAATYAKLNIIDMRGEAG